MPLIRPELAILIKRWSEVISGVLIALFGLWALRVNDFFFQVLAGLVIIAGLGIAFIGWRRIRFHRANGGPGIVQVVEAQISYFGPETGGFISARDLVELHLTGNGTCWNLIGQDGTRLDIPVGAEGADALFDIFANLPDVHMQSILGALDAAEPVAARPLWLHPSRRSAVRRLH
ncbi:hypothetical protein [Roseinatronobacter alkalisoli]|uniref:PH domain-containing protein n=1 Tax=Roseinatronobacter alkalisoli TaxID=3028235 RepID=A0ABT5TAH9_9RHOB|nr:hypothetical protein [Roseinatronobacter sp. HJB301]MDD7972133.1 hypothetical protein [Roseinatronobacter sp. HJB301]